MSRPRLSDELNPVAGLAAVALFGLFAAIFLTANFGSAAGLPTDVSITAGIGYAMFDLLDQTSLNTEGFLFAFLAIAFVLDAALGGALMLARREDEGVVRKRLTDGGTTVEDDE
jgi:NADH-quinone oxidoreductase subunit J